MPGYKKKCDWCRKNFYNHPAFLEHEPACLEAQAIEEQDKADAAAHELQEFTDVGFTEEQAEFLMYKYGSNS